MQMNRASATRRLRTVLSGRPRYGRKRFIYTATISPVWGDVETRRTIFEPRVAVQSPARAVPVTLPRKTEY